MPNERIYLEYQPGLEDGLDPDTLLGELGDSLAYHGNPSEALRELMLRGIGDSPGIAKLLDMLRRNRERLLSKYDPSKTIRALDEELSHIVDMERDSRERAFTETGDPNHLLAQMELDALPPGLGDRMRSLANYQFLDSDAAERYRDLVERLERMSLKSQLGSLRQAIEAGAAPEMAEMINRLARMVERYNQGFDISKDFETFKADYPNLVGENESFEDFLQRLAERAARTAAILNSLDQDARDQLSDLLASLMGSPELTLAMDRLSAALSESSAFVDKTFNFRGSEMLDLGTFEDVFDTLAGMDELEASLRESVTPDRLGRIDLDSVEEFLGRDAVDAVKQLSQLTRTLEEAGLINREGARLDLTPKAIRKLGNHLLEELFTPGKLSLVGTHESREQGPGTESTYESKPMEWGDQFNLDLGATVKSALFRSGPGLPVSLTPADFQVVITERRNRASTVLALDLSLSMPLNDTFLPAKKVALALSSLIRAKFPQDYLGYIVFSETAREVSLDALPSAQWDYVYGTNMEHALLLARLRLRSKKGFKQVLMITDGEPTAHIDPASKEIFFAYPPSRETLTRTLAEVTRCTKENIKINLFVLNANHSLRTFVNRLVAINKGKAFFSDGSELPTALINRYISDRESL